MCSMIGTYNVLVYRSAHPLEIEVKQPYLLFIHNNYHNNI